MDTDTLETDELGSSNLPMLDNMTPDWMKGLQNWVELSKKLERERDELRKRIEGRDHLSANPEDWGLEVMLTVACLQRNNARSLLRDIQKAWESGGGFALVTACEKAFPKLSSKEAP